MSEILTETPVLTRPEILNRMREITAEYQELAKVLSEMDAPNKRAEFEKDQRKRLEGFKKELKVHATEEAKEIDFEELEQKIFSEENLNSVALAGEGYSLGYDSEGQPGFGVSYKGGGAFTPYAYDKLDAERYVKRQRRKAKLGKR